MEKLVAGLHHFQQNIFRSRREFFEQLTHGQKPDALFITCSDSRINPNLITQTEPGELFILRNAGNIVPPYGTVSGGEAATIEYAVSVLGIHDLIVCGHTQCGAMQGLLHPETLKKLPAVDRWLQFAEATRRILDENYSHVTDETQLFHAAIEENVLVQLENLRTHPSVAAGVARGQLKLHAWVYELETGLVQVYDPVDHQFEPLDVQSQLPTPAVTGRGAI